MVTLVAALAHWLLRLAAQRWPAGQRADLMREWNAEISMIARDTTTGPIARQWHMLTFSGSLAVTPGAVQYAPFGAKRIIIVVVALSAYLLGLSLLQHGWYGVYQYLGEGERPVIDDPGLAARLVVGTVALLPVAAAALAGWLTGRTSTAMVRPVSLGLCLIAVVAAWVGIGFLSDAFGTRHSVPTMGYHFGTQPYGMLTSWLVWLLCFVAVAGLLLGTVGHRMVRGFLATVMVAAVSVTAATFVQFKSSTAPRADVWKWFAQWLVPPNPFETAVDEGAHSFHSARQLVFFVSSTRTSYSQSPRSAWRSCWPRDRPLTGTPPPRPGHRASVSD